jgi:hypothetical protein
MCRCLSLTSADAVRECETDAECQLEPPLGKGAGYFCALQPCCTNVAPVLNTLPQALLGNVSLSAIDPAAAAGPRRICRKDAAAHHAAVCSDRLAPVSLSGPSGLVMNITSPQALASTFNLSALASQAGLDRLQTTYTELATVRGTP